MQKQEDNYFYVSNFSAHLDNQQLFQRNKKRKLFAKKENSNNFDPAPMRTN